MDVNDARACVVESLKFVNATVSAHLICFLLRFHRNLVVVSLKCGSVS